MKSAFRRFLVVVGLAAAIPGAAAEITFYEGEGFRGRAFTVNQSISNFASVGFNDRASSVIVRSGAWQLCSDAFFRGRCVSVSRGEYPTLRSMELTNEVSSAREIDWLGGGMPPRRGTMPPGGMEGRVELFDNPGFSGRGLVVSGTITNFTDVGFNDRAQSMIVNQGTWEACEHADFQGACQIYGPGRYPSLGAFVGRISSIRAAGRGGPGLGGGIVGGGIVGGGVPGGGAPGGGAWGAGARAILYEGPNLSGRAYVIDDEVAGNLAGTGFNDRAASLRIEGGYWVFCSDANFGGECLTFGPGDYPTLPWGVHHRISSGRRIHDQYPYSQVPNWRR